MINIEVCANSITSAIAAQQGGATRVELCDNLNEGGTTPSHGQFVLAKKHITIPIFPLIRPRSGDFYYSDVEFEVMKADIAHFIGGGCDGIVIGILCKDGTVDKQRCSELVDMAKAAGISVTFHRAFDMCRDHFEAMEDIINLGCDRILTSGGKSSAIEGVNIISHLIKEARGRISVMPGSGINEHNIADLIHYTGATEFHSTAKMRVESQMEYQNDHILFNGFGGEFILEITDSERVKRLLALANA
ncbi:copper homeostasis protein CutC [Mucilaginibacter sp. PPCGB 2223]|uniref:copper homeostasis protein CutC n=1 Tax=Mucilaginibacter sp. PPCGB 2223 TaxID=1886027 RepID=UPI000A6D064F|nr:copper homeostasis protein CutC [Mucilaginibacter sp. PPCGB 2223]